MTCSSARRLPRLAVTIGFACLLASPTLGQAPQPVTGDAVRGAELYRSICAECHGENGAGLREKSSPLLHQQEDWYLLAQLEKFRTGIRGSAEGDSLGAQMREKAQALPDDAAMSDVVVFIKTIEGPGPPPATLEGDVEAGKAFFGTICIACHGADGRGMSVIGSPSLVGQSDWYVVSQINKFRSGTRGSDPRDVTGIQMKAITATITSDQTVLDVAAYVATLR